MKLIVLLSAALLAGATILSGCATTVNSQDSVVHLTKQTTVKLPALQLTEPVSAEQLLTIDYQGHHEQALVLLEGQDQSLRLSVLNPLGIRLVDASYDQGALTVTQHIPIAELPPAAQVLFDIFLGLLPAADIAEVLPPGFSLKDEGTTRTIYDEHGQSVEQVHFTNGQATRLEHHVFGYIITIENLSAAEE